MKFSFGSSLVIVAVIWADLHFLLNVFDGIWWHIIPLAGMLIITYGLYWVFERLVRHRKKLPQIANVFANVNTMLRVAQEHGYGKELVAQLISSPTDFEHRLRRTFNGRVEEPHV